MTNNKGFTLIEIMVAITISMILLISAGQLLRDSNVINANSNKITSLSLVYDIDDALINASSWYWGLSLEKGIKNDNKLLPENYIVFLQSDSINSQISGRYLLLQSQTRDIYTRIISKEEKELQDPSIYLKKITAKKNEEDLWEVISNVAIEYKNPVWITNFYINNNNFKTSGNIILNNDPDNTINEFLTPTPDVTYAILELEFFDNADKKRFIIKIYKNKEIYINKV